MNAPTGSTHWPKEIRLKSEEKILEIDFEDGARFKLPAELLRVESPSAEIHGHGSEEKTILPGRRHVGIMKVEPVGHYAIRIVFDDLHDSGIFTWDYLYGLGKNRDAIWAQYLKALEEKGLSRDP